MIKPIIMGMINKCFSYNTYIKNNVEDVEQDCLVEILKSIQGINLEKGKIFGYMNRVIKNTLLIQSNKIEKYTNTFLNMSSWETNDNESEDYDDNIMDALNIKYDTYTNNIKTSKKYLLNLNKSVFITYFGIKHIYNILKKTNMKQTFNILKYNENSDNLTYKEFRDIVSTSKQILLDTLNWYESNNPVLQNINIDYELVYKSNKNFQIPYRNLSDIINSNKKYFKTYTNKKDTNLISHYVSTLNNILDHKDVIKHGTRINRQKRKV